MKRLKNAWLHLRLHHLIFVFTATLTQEASCALCPSRWMAIVNLMLLVFFIFVPCRDPYFGVGRRHYWLRQTFFIGSFVLGLALLLFVPRITLNP